MHRLISISFVLLYVLAMFRPVQPILCYYLNQDYIAKYFCVNKDKPKIHCNGKCYLMKQLKKQNKEKNVLAIQWENYPIGFVYIFLLADQNEFAPFSKNKYFYADGYAYLFSTSSFHPPQV